MVVAVLRGGEVTDGHSEVLTGVARPELFLVDGMAAFTLLFCSGPFGAGCSGRGRRRPDTSVRRGAETRSRYRLGSCNLKTGRPRELWEEREA